MGLILDSSVLIADERGRFNMPGFLRQVPPGPLALSVIAVSELLHGIERAQEVGIRKRRAAFVEGVLQLT